MLRLLLMQGCEISIRNDHALVCSIHNG